MIHDTIAAISTPSGKGGLAVIRVSGQHAIEITQRIFKPTRQNVYQPKSWRLTSGVIICPKSRRLIDEVVVAFFKGPKSYTGEDLIEISCHGNPLIATTLMRLLIDEGARIAEPGEFTRRAFINGRIDLSRAEAVAEVTGAESDLATAAAVKLLQGGLERPVQRIRHSLLSVLTAIELDLDFPEESASITEENILNQLHDAQQNIENLLAAGQRGDLIRTGTDIVLAGRANAGKSSVFNLLSGRDRAIVSNEPGTTRDTLETISQWGDYTITLIDTAGIRLTDSLAETEAIRRSRERIEQASLIVYVLDGTCPDLKLLQSVSNCMTRSGIIVFWNKTDLGSDLPPDIRQHLSAFTNVCSVLSGSAKTGQGIIDLRKELTRAIQKLIPETTADSLMISLRQQNALISTHDAIYEACKAFDENDDPECIAMLLQSAHRSLGEILGDTVSPDVLGEIFSNFCIGK